MEYLTYIEYLEMGGSLPETAFDRYNFMAHRIIDHETFNRVLELEQIPKEVKMLSFELIELNAKADISAEKVSSESVGSWSKSYKDVSTDEYNSQTVYLVHTYLSDIYLEDGTPLLYRGC